MPEPEIGLADGGELNFDRSFQQFNLNKKDICEELLIFEEVN